MNTNTPINRYFEVEQNLIEMNLQEAKLGVMQKIMSVSKTSLIAKIDKILDEEMVVGYTADGKPLTREAYNTRLEAGREQIKNGQYITQEELEKESENW